MPARARCCYVLAHGAGAGMAHPFMAAVADELAERSIATLRFQFHYMEQGSKRPDPPALAQAAVRAAVATAGELAPGLPLIAGGKSFGGRMTSQAQAASPLRRRAWARLPRLSAAPGRQAVGWSRRASPRCESADAVPAGNA
jgi:predicted alpha/beta-hydrolase family hydrolase